MNVYNAMDLNITNVIYVLEDIILLMIHVFYAIKIVFFVHGPEIHNVNNVQQIATSMILMKMEQESAEIVTIAAQNVLLQLTVNV